MAAVVVHAAVVVVAVALLELDAVVAAGEHTRCSFGPVLPAGSLCVRFGARP